MGETRRDKSNAGGVERAPGGERGAIAILVALMLPMLLLLTAFAVDITRWYVEMQRLQRAADAAALAAAPFMPESLQNNLENQPAPWDRATAAARDLVTRNGFTGSTARVETGIRPSQVRVTLNSTVNNVFASIIGLNTTGITRSAVAEFSGPAPLGSPCNVHGNEPWVSGSSQGSVLPSSGTAPNCSNYPQFWSTIVGPEVYKTQGDQYAARKCGVDPYQESGCATAGVGGANAEYDPRGYVITVRVREALTGSLAIQLYDPAYVDTDSRCESLPSITDDTPGTNTYVDDATQRYRRNPNPISASKPSYCTGDSDNAGLRFGAETPMVTSFGLIKPTDTLNPFDPAANGFSPGPTSNRICSAQFPGWGKDGGGDGSWSTPHAHAGVAIGGGTATQQLSRNSEFTRLFHRWVGLCTITGPVPAGDYYLRVRSNVAPGAGADAIFGFSDNASVRSNGSNRFAVRAVPTNSAENTKVSVSPYSRMPIFANSDSSTAVFNLVRVLPGNAGQAINFTFYDVGDAGGAPGATLSVLTPSGAAATNCTKEGRDPGPGLPAVADPDCSISNILNSNGWNGQFQRMRIPIPASYTCNFNDPYACWWRLRVAFGGGVSVTDQTTWTAVVEGDPVRLVE
jgi:Flp pilus assembly protein TadG